MENPDLFEGDILGVESPEDLNAIARDDMRWPENTVPYVIDNALIWQVAIIKRAMKEYHEKTCIKFVERTTEANYINIFKGQGCYSYVGLVHRGQQPVSLGQGCHVHGTIVHELGHAIGFFHEQNRSDRDEYLTIYWDNIKEGMADQFALLKPEQNRLLSPFDFDSIMLYGSMSFSKDRTKLRTMEGKGGRFLDEVYNKPGLAASDIARIKKLYKC
ncbi:MEP1B [Cordylochernes scorpioides]|uniref:Metalloendopeptidase n=1 Tax=Cordylochernes scorpioides TaxID=51811 RepID=A0ABY6L711_9ARAC|nr:MEP1B [Cordylochernes scorpioides]